MASRNWFVAGTRPVAGNWTPSWHMAGQNFQIRAKDSDAVNAPNTAIRPNSEENLLVCIILFRYLVAVHVCALDSA